MSILEEYNEFICSYCLAIKNKRLQNCNECPEINIHHKERCQKIGMSLWILLLILITLKQSHFKNKNLQNY